MKMKMQYQVVLEETLEDLERLVNELLENGWQLQGGVAVVWKKSWELPNFYQAMTKVTT